MNHFAPLSPSPSVHGGDLLPPGFEQLIKHNISSTSCPRSAAMTEEHNTDMSHPVSRYPSPLPQYPTPTDHNAYLSLDRSLTPVHMHVSNGYHTPMQSPPSHQEWPSTRSTSSRSLRMTPNRIQKQAPKKRVRNKAAANASLAVGGPRPGGITRPLSESTAENPDVEVADIEAFVNRSTEQRMAELHDAKSKAPGKIKRPMNAFMLYRKAYQNLAKRMSTQNNHQLVSQVCGSSWPLEPETLRLQFTEWARIERTNHQRAHPEYKFSPAKPKPREDEEHHSESDGDGEWRPGRGGGVGAVGSRWFGGRARPPSEAILFDAYANNSNNNNNNSGNGINHDSIGLHQNSSPPSLYHRQYPSPNQGLGEPYQHDVFGSPQQLHQQSQHKQLQQQQQYYPGHVLDNHLHHGNSSPVPSYHDIDHTFDLGNYHPSVPNVTGVPQFYTPQYGVQVAQHEHGVFHYHQPLTQQQQQQPLPQQQQPQRQYQALHQQQALIDPNLMGAEGDFGGFNDLGAAGTPLLGLGEAIMAEDPAGDYLRGGHEDWQVELDTLDWERTAGQH